MKKNPDEISMLCLGMSALVAEKIYEAISESYDSLIEPLSYLEEIKVIEKGERNDIFRSAVVKAVLHSIGEVLKMEAIIAGEDHECDQLQNNKETNKK